MASLSIQFEWLLFISIDIFCVARMNVLINGNQWFEDKDPNFDEISKFEKTWFGNPSKPIIMSRQLLLLLLYPLHKIPGDA